MASNLYEREARQSKVNRVVGILLGVLDGVHEAAAIDNPGTWALLEETIGKKLSATSRSMVIDQFDRAMRLRSAGLAP